MTVIRFTLKKETQLGDRIFVVGNHIELGGVIGGWDPEKTKVELHTSENAYPVWCAEWKPEKPTSVRGAELHFKFVVRNEFGEFCWEDGFEGDRTLQVGFTGCTEVTAEWNREGFLGPTSTPAEERAEAAPTPAVVPAPAAVPAPAVVAAPAVVPATAVVPSLAAVAPAVVAPAVVTPAAAIAPAVVWPAPGANPAPAPATALTSPPPAASVPASPAPNSDGQSSYQRSPSGGSADTPSGRMVSSGQNSVSDAPVRKDDAYNTPSPRSACTSRSTRTSAMSPDLIKHGVMSQASPAAEAPALPATTPSFSDTKTCWAVLKRMKSLHLGPTTLEQAVEAELEARRLLDEKKVEHAKAIMAAPLTVASAQATAERAAAELKLREAAWEKARDEARKAMTKEFGAAETKPAHNAGHGHGDHDDLLHGAKHQLEHRWIEKTGFGVAERVVAHAADSLTERVLERGGEAMIERGVERLAERSAERAAEHMATRVMGEAVRMGELAAINTLKCLRVIVPFIGMIFVWHLAKHDMHRFKEEKGLPKLFFLLAVIGDWIDILVHVLVVYAGIGYVDHHWLHEMEANGMKAAIFACLSVMGGEILSARAKRLAAAKKAPGPQIVAVAGP